MVFVENSNRIISVNLFTIENQSENWNMKSVILISCILLLNLGYGQSIKKKYLGLYSGTIPTYKMDIGSDVIDVQPVSISIELFSNAISQQIGLTKREGSWRIYFEGKSYYILNARFDNQLVEERIIVYKKGKKIGREGLFPQPTTELKKI